MQASGSPLDLFLIKRRNTEVMYDQGPWQFSNEFAAEAPARLGKTQIVGSYTLSSSFNRPGWGLRICISNS